MQKQILEAMYTKHHERGARYGYLFCQGERIPYLKRWVGKGKRVLDLGCRDGKLTEGFVEGNQVVGADVDRRALKLCGERLGIETCWVDLNEEWLWDKETFDVVVACEILEHLLTLDWVMEKIWRTLKRGGIFIGSVPNAFRMRNRMKFFWGREYETDPTHVRQFSYRKLESTLREFFTEAQILPLGGGIFPFVPVTQSSPKRVSLLFAKDLLWRAVKG